MSDVSKGQDQNACSPLTSLSASLGASTINGDVIATCVHQNEGAFDGLAH